MWGSSWSWGTWTAAGVGSVIAVLVLVYMIEFAKMVRLHRQLAALPGPSTWLEATKLFGEKKGEFHLAMREVASRWGPLARMMLLYDPCVVISDPEMIRQVWQVKNLPKSQSYPRMAYIIGENLLTENGEQWKVHRKLMQSGFMPQQLNAFIPIFQRYADKLCERILRDIRTRPDLSANYHIDDVVQSATLDIIAASAMRYDLGCLDGRNQDLVRSFNALLAALANPLTHLPLGKYLVRLRYLPHIRRVDRAVWGAIRQGQKDVPPAGTAPRDLLDVLLMARDSETGQGLSPQSIRNQILIFFIAGHDTTAITLSFALYELVRHPEWLQRLVDEVDRVCGAEMPTAEHLPQLIQMTMVLKETLRLYPAVASSSRRNLEPVELGGVTIPPGVAFQVPIDAVHHRADLWPEPHRFDPLRFTEEACSKRHPFAWIPFTQGPRICLGMNFFWLEGRLLLARLLQRLQFRAVPGFAAQVTSRTGTSKSANGITVQVRERPPRT